MDIIGVALPSYSHLIGGPLPRWVLAALGGNLVPPRENLGGSYPMLNYAVVALRPSVIQNGTWIMLQEGEPSYSHYRGGFYFAPQSEALVPPRENLGGSYSMLNSISVRPFVRQIWDYSCSVRKCAFLQPSDRRAIIEVGFRRSQERSSCPTERESRWFLFNA